MATKKKLGGGVPHGTIVPPGQRPCGDRPHRRRQRAKLMATRAREAVGDYPVAMLDDLQAGHLRRMIDLSEQLPDDWSGMMGRTAMQEDFDALRFQLAYMSYALALCHAHRLPAAPAVFRQPIDNLIHKMLSQEVWSYWHFVSTGNGPMNQSLGELPAKWNPVEVDNIMYSAYIQSMALMYHYLFDDSKYAAEGGLSFRLEPLFWGKGGQTFVYDEKSLTQHLYWNMVQRGYLGIACEPNCVFQICNQPAILGFRLHDLVYGGSIAEEVTAGYRRAWNEFGITDDTGHYHILVQEREHALVERPPAPWADFWLGSLMHMWDPAGVEAVYPRQMADWVRPGPGDTLWIHPSIRPRGPATSNALDFGWAAVCASEVGDVATLRRLLGYADTCLTPTWHDGAFYYRRRDGWLDASGKLHAMDPHTGNALLGYARLNVPGGLHKLYAEPLDPRRFTEPALIEMTAGLDVRAACYDRDAARLDLIVRPGRIAGDHADLTIGNAWQRGDWRVRLNGTTVATGDGTDVTAGHGPVSARRDDNTLIMQFPVSPETAIQLDWAA